MIVKLLLFLIILNKSYAQVEVLYLNQSFTWIKVSSKYVKARMTHPKEGLAIFWIEVKTPKESFEFITRRAVPINECIHLVSESRKLIKAEKTLEIIGDRSTKTKTGDYFSMFELLRGKNRCVGYFGDCENFEQRTEEWKDWKSKPIDPKLYP